MPNTEAQPLLERFLDGLRPVVSLEALWAHGSLALGDYQPHRSDLDIIAVVGDEITPEGRRRLEELHRTLHREEALAEKLHCSYMVRSELADVRRDHLTWAHAGLFHRPVTPVTRRELQTGGLLLHGRAPDSGLLPDVSDGELEEFIRTDLREFWLPATAKRRPWLRDIWAHLGPLTVARTTVTLRDGRLITKREALEVLAGMGAPAALLADIREHRYAAAPGRPSPPWRLRRARLARRFVRSRILAALNTTGSTA